VYLFRWYFILYMSYQLLWESHKFPPLMNSNNILSVFHKQMPVLICFTCMCNLTDYTSRSFAHRTQLFVVPNVSILFIYVYQGPTSYRYEWSLYLLTYLAWWFSLPVERRPHTPCLCPAVSCAATSILLQLIWILLFAFLSRDLFSRCSFLCLHLYRPVMLIIMLVQHLGNAVVISSQHVSQPVPFQWFLLWTFIHHIFQFVLAHIVNVRVHTLMYIPKTHQVLLGEPTNKAHHNFSQIFVSRAT